MMERKFLLKIIMLDFLKKLIIHKINKYFTSHGNKKKL